MVTVTGPKMMMCAPQLPSCLPHEASSVVPSMTPHHMHVRLDVATPLGNERQPKQAHTHECEATWLVCFDRVGRHGA